MLQKPELNEHAPYFSRYISLVQEGDFFSNLDASFERCEKLFLSLSEAKAAYRYAPEKWTPKEILMHLIDTERVFAYRAMAISRKEQISLPGFDENAYANSIDVSSRTIKDLIEEFSAVRIATKAFFKYLPEANATIIGTANQYPTSPRAIAYMIIGHVIHHCNILEERYL
jgi:uncharacterized damage-inducible protein DinB